MGFKDRCQSLLKTAVKQLGEEVVYLPFDGGRFVINGIFDEKFKIQDPETDSAVISTVPVLHINSLSLPVEPLREDELIVLGKKFKVHEVLSDGQGGLSLALWESEDA